MILMLAFTSVAQGDPSMDGPTIFALLQNYHSSFRDVSFLHEGTVEDIDPPPNRPHSVMRFQTFYAYRSDGATLLDVFSQHRDGIGARSIYAILHGKMELMNATPDAGRPVRLRSPQAGPGGPGSLGRFDSPERIFLDWYFPTLGEPAEHDFKAQGWEDLSGQRCLKVGMLQQPRRLLVGWKGAPPSVRYWIDPQRDGYPIRYERYRGDRLYVRGEITSMQRLQIPGGRAIWFPIQGKVWGFSGRKGLQVEAKPTSVENHGVLVKTVKFNQGLKDAFFSAKKHALAASAENMRKLQRELERAAAGKKREVVRIDPESRRKRLDEALKEADRQARQLEASLAARAGLGWSGALYGGLGVAGVVMLGIGAFWSRRSRCTG